MIVAGGVYYERCLTPSVLEMFGSGGRAAVALSGTNKVTLHTFFPEHLQDEVTFNMGSFGVQSVVHPSDAVVQFFYNFPLSMPRIAPVPVPRAESANVAGDKVVRFGCIEGEMIVDAGIAIYDPQSGSNPQPFKANGSKAERLALVLNTGELARLAKLNSDEHDMEALVAALTDEPEIVIVKSGPHGAHVFEGGVKVGTVPAYKSEAVYKIGSGDVFTAMFANGWAVKGLSASEAADEASRYVAGYVESRIPTMSGAPPDKEPIVPHERPRKIYLAGSFFSTEHLWLIDEVHAAIESLGVECFSPWHDVGVGTGPEIAQADLKELDECDVLLGLVSDMDPGTLVEIGYAISEKCIPIFLIAENTRPQDLTMMQGDNIRRYDDLSTAIYHAAWSALE